MRAGGDVKPCVSKKILSRFDKCIELNLLGDIMETILQKILLLLAITILFGTVVYPDENKSDIMVEDVLQDVKKHMPTFQTNTESVQTGAERVMLIKANILNVKIVAGLYAFSLIIIIFLMKITAHHAKDIVTIVGLVSVIFGILLLVLMIGDTEQMTAPIGIFGAIAGYLFGSAQKKESPKELPL